MLVHFIYIPLIILAFGIGLFLGFRVSFQLKDDD